MNKYYERNKDKILKKQKERIKTPEEKEKHRLYLREWKEKRKDPDYVAAQLKKKNMTDDERKAIHNERQKEYYQRVVKPRSKSKPREKREKKLKVIKGIPTVYSRKPKVDKQEFYKEIVISKAQDKLTPKAEKYLIRVGDVALKKNQGTEADKKDIKQAAFLRLFSQWKTFDETRFDNPLAYYTEVFKRAMAFHWNILHNKKTETGTPAVKLIYFENVDW